MRTSFISLRITNEEHPKTSSYYVTGILKSLISPRVCFSTTTSRDHLCTVFQVFLQHSASIWFFCSFHRVEQAAVMKHLEQEEKQRQRALRYANAIRHQMQERRGSVAARRKRTFQEGRELTQKEQQRRLLLGEIREKKLQELR